MESKKGQNPENQIIPFNPIVPKTTAWIEKYLETGRLSNKFEILGRPLG
jgi:hypothetical protein